MDSTVAPLRRGRWQRPQTTPTFQPALESVRFGSLELPPPGQIAILGLGFMLSISYASMMIQAAWSPRFVLLMMALPCGLAALGLLATRRDRAAMAAVALLTIAIASAAISGDARTSLLGQVGKDSSVLILAATLGVWALGRLLTGRSRTLLCGVFAVGLGIQALVAIAQVVFDIRKGPLALLAADRTAALTGSPVHLGGLMAGAVGMCVAFVLRGGRRWPLWLAGIGLCTTAANLSGTRVALLAIGVLVVVLGVLHRTWRIALVVVAVSLGVVGSSQLGSPGTSTQRTTQSSYGRSEVWTHGLEALAEKPYLGWGTGRFLPAVQHRFSGELVRDTAIEDVLQPWRDPHNIVIDFLVTTGLLGAACLGAFVWFAARRARGPLAALAAGIAMTWLLQPVATSTAPLAMLALGASMMATAPSVAEGTWSHRRRAAVGILVTVGVGLGAFAAVADARMGRAMRGDDPQQAAAAAAAYPGDAVAADLVAQAWVRQILGGDESEEAWEQALLWVRRATEREPDRTVWWSRLAALQLGVGRYDEARASAAQAISLQNWNAPAWLILAEVAAATDDEPLADLAAARLCVLQLAPC